MRRNVCRNRRGFTLVELLVVIAIIGVLVALLLPAVQAAREAARRSQCANRLKQLGLAMHNYESSNLCFPTGTINATPRNTTFPAGPDDPNGRNGDGRIGIGAPWICLMLPYLEQPGLHDNLKLIISQRPEVVDWFGNGTYAATPIGDKHLPAMDCPSHPFNDEQLDNGTGMEHLARGNYCANYGRLGYGEVNTRNGQTGGLFGNNHKIGMQDVTDGLSNTLAFSELKYRKFNATVQTPNILSKEDSRGTWSYATMGGNTFTTLNTPNSATPDLVWGCRNYLPDGMPCSQGGTPFAANHAAARGYHPGGVMGCLGDGSTRFFSTTIDLATWQGLGSRGGGEAIGNF